jgi:3-isopropylmalate/(R)-2-methylmalate dehydratase small subunit
MSRRAWVFGDRIDTDVLAPGHLMKLPPEALAARCLESVDPGFASGVRPGDVLVAGHAFGIGSSREQAAISLKLLGLGALLARSYARIFWRNALNAGLPALILDQDAGISAGDMLRVDARAAFVFNETTRTRHALRPLPGFLLDMVEAGGLLETLRRRGQATAGSSSPAVIATAP